MNGYNFFTSPILLELFIDPDVVSISPQYGPESGGTRVNIYGKYFSSQNPSCKFGGQIVAAIYISDKELLHISSKAFK